MNSAAESLTDVMLSDTSLQTSAIPQDGPRQIPVGDVVESDWNPRKYFPAAAHEKLVLSMREQGFWPWNALVGRPVENGFIELAAGHRRRRAALEAGLATVPVYVREMNDEEFLRVLTFDNSNREDPHPLDEAAGFRFFIDKTGAKVADIAAIIGQKVGYVYERLKCIELIDDGKQAFWAEKITSGHAVQIARLPVNEQKRALKKLEQTGYQWSVRELGSWIEREVHRDVRKAHFDAEDATLVKNAPRCSDCSRRAGNVPALGDLDPNTCTDPGCYAKKQSAFVQLQIDANPSLVKVSEDFYMNKQPAGVLLKSEYDFVKPGDKKCDFAVAAVVVSGEIGKRLQICCDRDCPVHRGRNIGGSSRQRELTAAEIEAERLEDLHEEIERTVRKRIPATIAAKCSVPFGRRELSLILRTLFESGMNFVVSDNLAKLGGDDNDVEPDADTLNKWLASVTVETLSRFLIRVAADESSLTDEDLKIFGCDGSAIRKAVTAELDPPKKKAKPAAAKKPAPKPAAKKTAKPAGKHASKPSAKKAAKKK